MSARIRFQGGPLAGRVYLFDDDRDEIVIGRDPDRADVVLPAEWVDVGREHLALRRTLGRYRLVLSPSHPVFLDGEPAIADQELGDVAEIRLGENGPLMIVQTMGAQTVPPTIETQTPAPTVPEMIRTTRRQARINRRFLLATASVLLALVVTAFFLFRNTGRRVRRVTDAQAAVRGMLASEAQIREALALEQREATEALRGRLAGMDESIATIRPDLGGLREAIAGLGPRMRGLEARIQRLTPRVRRVLAAASPSVYVVLIRMPDGLEDPVGTAWIAAPGVLVTNAHVARLFDLLSSKPKFELARLVVRSPGKDAHDHVVETVTIHPGWTVFSELWSEYRPIDVDLAGNLNPLQTSGACDVALLEVADPDTLGPPLKIADPEALEGLGAGDVVGFVGYPAENMSAGGVNPRQPSPTTQVAHVTAVTNYFLAPDEAEHALLVQHSLPATGGASGSPILDENGHVVAVLNAGNVTVGGLGQRIPSAVLVNFAQRADLVRELLDKTADETQKARTARWRDGIRTFTSLRAAIERNSNDYLKRFLAEVEKKGGGPPVEVETHRGILGSADPQPSPVTEDRIPLHLQDPGVYVFFVYATMGQAIGLEIFDERDPAKAIDTDGPDHWTAVLQVKTTGAGDVQLVVQGAADTEFLLSVYRVPPKAP